MWRQCRWQAPASDSRHRWITPASAELAQSVLKREFRSWSKRLVLVNFTKLVWWRLSVVSLEQRYVQPSVRGKEKGMGWVGVGEVGVGWDWVRGASAAAQSNHRLTSGGSPGKRLVLVNFTKLVWWRLSVVSLEQRYVQPSVRGKEKGMGWVGVGEVGVGWDWVRGASAAAQSNHRHLAHPHARKVRA